MKKVLPRINEILFVNKHGECHNLQRLAYCEDLKIKKEEISKLSYKEWLINRRRIQPSSYIEKKVSRAYYKLSEIMVDTTKRQYNGVLCLCEAPGGFAQYLLENTSSNLFLFSLISKDQDVPTFNPIIKNNNRVTILSNSYNKGDILDINNIRNFNRIKVDLVTADGGIPDEFYDLKEQAHLELIYCELLSACCSLNETGTFILKIFDTFTEKMYDILCIISFLFDVEVVKPASSRITNSEKYLVCTNFEQTKFNQIKKNMFAVLSNFSKRNGFLHKPVSLEMTDSIVSINKILMERQIDSISKCLVYN